MRDDNVFRALLSGAFIKFMYRGKPIYIAFEQSKGAKYNWAHVLQVLEKQVASFNYKKKLLYTKSKKAFGDEFYAPAKNDTGVKWDEASINVYKISQEKYDSAAKTALTVDETFEPVGWAEAELIISHVIDKIAGVMGTNKNSTDSLTLLRSISLEKGLEHRKAEDGKWYTKEEFRNYFDGTWEPEWEKAHTVYDEDKDRYTEEMKEMNRCKEEKDRCMEEKDHCMEEKDKYRLLLESMKQIQEDEHKHNEQLETENATLKNQLEKSQTIQRTLNKENMGLMETRQLLVNENQRLSHENQRLQNTVQDLSHIIHKQQMLRTNNVKK